MSSLFFYLAFCTLYVHVPWPVVILIKMTGSAMDIWYAVLVDCGKQRVSNKVLKALFRGRPDQTSLMHASKAILNLPTSSLHLCSPLQQNRKVKIHHQNTSFPKQLGQDSPPRK